jgi:hypothetical protein
MSLCVAARECEAVALAAALGSQSHSLSVAVVGVNFEPVSSF